MRRHTACLCLHTPAHNPSCFCLWPSIGSARFQPPLSQIHLRSNPVFKILEEENADFFKAYYTSIKLIQQIRVLNELLEEQGRLMQQLAPQQIRVLLNSLENTDFQDSAGTQMSSQNQMTFGQNNAPDHQASAPPHSFSISFSGHSSRKLTHQDILVVRSNFV
ncbi:hypothetical protein CJ030_MR7G015171 [Morella rubra]|uniref:Uncharacterized protein n=1 Tax=Morella rubra TaxID=262757 RepID=A0A6A1UX48_9ROSI|nr:hypothetical protein CJ030_MR7G015171 [Morella rubra]